MLFQKRIPEKNEVDKNPTLTLNKRKRKKEKASRILLGGKENDCSEKRATVRVRAGGC